MQNRYDKWHNLYTEQDRREWRSYSVWKRLGTGLRRLFSIQMLRYQYLDRRYKLVPFVVTDAFYILFALFIGTFAILEFSKDQYLAAPAQLLMAVAWFVTPIIRRLLTIGQDRFALAFWAVKIMAVIGACVMAAINLHKLFS